MRVCALAFLLTQTRSDGGSSESEHADVTVSPVRRPGSAPTVTSATAPAHWRIACLKLCGSIAMLRSPVLDNISSTANCRGCETQYPHPRAWFRRPSLDHRQGASGAAF